MNSNNEGRLLEMFGCSTYTPIKPVNRVQYKDTTLLLNKETGGKFGKELNEMIFTVMSGDNKHPWITPFE